MKIFGHILDIVDTGTGGRGLFSDRILRQEERAGGEFGSPLSIIFQNNLYKAIGLALQVTSGI